MYEWAGDERRYTTSRNPHAAFARPQFITAWMEAQFEALNAKRQLRHAGREAFALEAAIRVNEINAGHPFIDGNGRTQRVWLRLLARQAGHELVLYSADRQAWNEASAAGFHGEEKPMVELTLTGLARGRGESRGAH